DNKLIPGGAVVGTHRTPLLAAALVNGEPDGTVGGHMDMTVQASTLCSYPVVGQHAWAIACSQVIAALAGSGTNNVLRAIVHSLAVVDCVHQRIGIAQNE